MKVVFQGETYPDIKTAAAAHGINPVDLLHDLRRKEKTGDSWFCGPEDGFVDDPDIKTENID